MPRSNDYPLWYTRSIIRKIKTKSKYLQTYKLNGSTDAYNSFRQLRGEIKADMARSYSSYLGNIENNIKINPKHFFSYISLKNKSNTVPTSMSYNGSAYDDPLDIADAFASFFQSNYTLDTRPINNFVYPPPTNITLALHCFKEDEVLSALMKIKPELTAGPDMIPAFLLSDCSPVLARPLAVIFNACLASSVYPDAWKECKSVPVLKSDATRRVIENYREIVIMNNFPKVFEILLHDIIYAHVSGCISESQHGFVRGRSTATNLFCITQDVAQALDNRLQTDVVYTDFSKAFNRVNHELLLGKLGGFGLSSRLLELIKSYLSNRKQYVVLHGFKSSKYVVATSGVPQGSVLGPLFFNVFINDVVSMLQVKCLLYADDMKLYATIRSASDCLRLQESLDCLSQWCNENQLSLNPLKCKVLTFSLSETTITHRYCIDNTLLGRPPTVRDLGVEFDPRLSFVCHIQTITSEALRMVGYIVRNSRGFTNVDTIKLLFTTYVRPKIEYCSVIWSPGYITHAVSLEAVQRRFLKYLAFRTDHVYPERGYPHGLLLERFAIASLDSRRHGQCLVFLWKIIHGQISCPDLLRLLQLVVPRQVTRYPRTFMLETPRTNVLAFSPLHKTITSYHDIQADLDIFACTLSDIKCINLNRGLN